MRQHPGAWPNPARGLDMPDATHDPHRLPQDRRVMIGHLVDEHGADAGDLPRSRDALQLVHARLHGGRAARRPALPQADNPSLTPAACLARAEDAFAHAVDDLEVLGVLDPQLAADLAVRWAAALSVSHGRQA